MIYFDEIKRAKDLLNGCNDKVAMTDLVMLAKYFKYTGLDIGVNLQNYIKSKQVIYNQVKYEKMIELAIKNAEQNNIRENLYIPITNYEIAKIISVPDFDCQRVAFIMLAVAKYYFLNRGSTNFDHTSTTVIVNNSPKDIFEMAKVSYTKRNKEKIYKALYDYGLIDLTNGSKPILLFADLSYNEYDMIKMDNDMVYVIYKYNGHRVYKCDICDKHGLMKSKKGVLQRYCPDCRVVKNGELLKTHRAKKK